MDARAGPQFDWGSLSWCQAYTTAPDGCYDVENIMLDEFGHVEILNHHVNYANDPDYPDAVVQAVSRTKPKPAGTRTRFGRCDVASLQLQYDMPSWGAKYSTCLDLATTLSARGEPDGRRQGRDDHADSDAQGRRRLELRPARAQPGPSATVTLQRRTTGTTTWTPSGRWPRQRRGHLHEGRQPHVRARSSGRVFTEAGRRRPPRRHVAVVTVAVGVAARDVPRCQPSDERDAVMPSIPASLAGLVARAWSCCQRLQRGLPRGVASPTPVRRDATIAPVSAADRAPPTVRASRSRRRDAGRRRRTRAGRAPMPRPAGRTLAVEGGDPVDGELGSSLGERRLGFPWLPGAPIHVGGGEP